jgi:3-hydroxyacyl-[acyl-carrier-protein] dehydratase
MNQQMDPLAKALTILPHGPEFRFVDRLTSLIAGKEGMGEYQVRPEAPFLRGHFPGTPIFPGVLLIEAAAQMAGIVAQCDPTCGPLADLKLTALKGVKILGSAKPGEWIKIEAKITGRLGTLIQAQAQISVADRVVLLAELTLSGAK